MGYALLWLENLTVSLLFVATLTAVICRRSDQPTWPWVRHGAPPALLLVLALAGIRGWTECSTGRFFDPSDPLALALDWLTLIAVAWLLFLLWRHRSAVKAWFKGTYRSWGPPLAALFVVYAWVGALIPILNWVAPLSDAWADVLILLLIIVPMLILVWFLLRKGQRWLKIAFPVAAIALPFLGFLGWEILNDARTLPTLVIAAVVAILSLWIARGDAGNRLRALLVGLAISMITVLYAATTWGAGYLQTRRVVIDSVWFHSLCLLTVSFVAGAIGIAVVGLRQKEDITESPAARWSRGKLTIALAVAVALHLMTFWNVDLGVKQRLTTLQTEANALAMSMAPPRIPARENAAMVYYQAIDVLDPTMTLGRFRGGTWFDALVRPAFTFDHTDEQLREYLKTQTHVLALLKEGAKRPDCNFDRDYSLPAFMPLGEPQDLSLATAMIAAETQCHVADGNVSGANLRAALSNVNTMFAIAEHLASEPILQSMVTATVIDRRATHTLQIVLAAAKPTTEDLDLVRVNSDLSYYRAMRLTYRMQEAFMWSLFCDIATGRLGSDQWAGPSTHETLASRATRFIVDWPLFYRVFLFESDLAGYRDFMKESRKLIRLLPPNEVQQQWVSIELAAAETGTGFVTGKLLPATNQIVDATARGDVSRGLSRLALAAARYRAVHGQLPETLEALVPQFIPLIPRDPFDGKSLKMKTTDEGGLILYSIGSDFPDDGGTPCDLSEQKGDYTFEFPN